MQIIDITALQMLQGNFIENSRRPYWFYFVVLIELFHCKKYLCPYKNYYYLWGCLT